MSTHRVIDFPKRPERFRRFWRAVAIGLLVGGVGGGLYWQGVHVPRQRAEAISVQLGELTDSVEKLQALLQGVSADLPKAEAPASQPGKVVDHQPQSYWLAISGADVGLTAQSLTLEADTEPEAAVKIALETLLAGPKRDRDVVTSIPEGTRLLNLKMTSSGIYVDLSSEFSQGGGTSSMITRVAQVLYTATCLEPTAGIFLSVEGQPISGTHPLGGEGLVISQPLTRAQFVKDFPPNLVKELED